MDAYGDEDPLPVYVVDSVGVTQQLNRCQDHGMNLVSRMPRTSGLPDKLIDRGWDTGDWTTIGVPLSDRDDAAEYRLQPFQETLYGESYRFVVVHSSMLNRRNKRTSDNELERTETNLQDELNDLADRSCACEADALQALKRFRNNEMDNAFDLEATVESTQRRKTRDGPGRPPD